MKGFKSKKGISLIVLVITIIVMIILAAAIILSLNNSGIIDKANKAKKDSDTANLKEYVNILEAEYELMTEAERAGKTSIEYVNNKLAEKGYKRRLNEDGILLTENAVEVLDAGIQIGDTVVGYNKYLTQKTINTSGNERTAINDYENDLYNVEVGPQPQSISNSIEYGWKYAGISENGEIMIIPDTSESLEGNLEFSGANASKNVVSELHDICDKLYSSSKGIARSIKLEDIIDILGIEKPLSFDKEVEIDFKNNSIKMDGNIKDNVSFDEKRVNLVNMGNENNHYWIATLFGGNEFYLKNSSGSVLPSPIGPTYLETAAVCPIVSLNSDVTITKDASAENTWNI